jgi:hypothetical protein
MQTFEVTLTQKIKKILSAESASEAVRLAQDEVTTAAEPFIPTNWTVKEKAGE